MADLADSGELYSFGAHRYSGAILSAKLLVVELWGLGDLLIATPFLQAASERFEVTLLAKPYARDLQPRFWKKVKVVPLSRPGPLSKANTTYVVPWRRMVRLRKQLARERFEFGLSARGTRVNHLLLMLARAKERLGYPRLRSEIFFDPANGTSRAKAHRYEHWQPWRVDSGLNCH